MIRVVLDTNVFVSAIFWGGLPLQILEAWGEQKFRLVYSHEILEEYTRVAYLLKKKYKARLDIPLTLEILSIQGEMVSSIHLDKSVSRDPDDDKFIACALGAECFLIVSGDKDLLDISGFAGINVIKPADFITTHL